RPRARSPVHARARTGRTHPLTSFPGFGAPGRSSREWILRPFVFRVASPQVLSHVEVARAPEAREIASDLHRAVRRRQQVHPDGNPSVHHARGLRQSEHFLDTHGENGSRGIAVVDRDARAGGYLEVSRRELIEIASLLPVEQAAQRLREIEALDVAQTTR